MNIVAQFELTKLASSMGLLGNDSALVWIAGENTILDILPREVMDREIKAGATKPKICIPAMTLEEIASIVPGELRVDFSRQQVEVEFILPEKAITKDPPRVPPRENPKNEEYGVVKPVGTYRVACAWGGCDQKNAASAAMWCMIVIAKAKRAS